MTPRALASAWRDEAALLRKRGQEPAAVLLESVAAELDAVLREHELEALPLDRAAAESGLSYSALQRAVREGRIPNAGARGRPAVRRADLPRKGGRQRPRVVGGPDLAGDVIRARCES